MIPAKIECPECGETAWYAVGNSKTVIYTCESCGHDTKVKRDTDEEANNGQQN